MLRHQQSLLPSVQLGTVFLMELAVHKQTAHKQGQKYSVHVF